MPALILAWVHQLWWSDVETKAAGLFPDVFACPRRFVRALVLAVFDPDCVLTRSRDDKAGPLAFFLFTPHRHAGFRLNLAHQLAGNEACRDFRCGSFV